MFRSLPLRQTARAVAGPLAWVAGFSCFLNVLYLAAPLYMMQVYDRVMHSRSVPTLLYLTLIVALCYLTYAILDAVRGHVLAGVSDLVEDRLGRVLIAHVTTPARRAQDQSLAVHIARDLDTVRQFAAGAGALAFIDLPWAPIYLAAIALLHPYLGLYAVGAAIVLLGLTLATEQAARQPMSEAGKRAARAYQFSEAVTRHADCARTMGLGTTLAARWRTLRGEMLAAQSRASHRTVMLGAASKCARLFFQSSILGLGAWLAINDEVSGGAIFAGSLLLSRTLAPVEAIIGAWRSTLAAKEALNRIGWLTANDTAPVRPVALPAARGELVLDGVTWAPAGAARPVVRGVSLRIEPGAALVMVGASSAGKSTIARLMVGAMRPDSGSVRLDGADLATWDAAQLGTTIGYLPQDVALFPGTIRDNIARFGEADDAAVVAASKAANAHDMIVRLPQGYQTLLDDAAMTLSGGQKQRIALARALLEAPSVVVLDEPNANLDSEGEAALTECVQALKRRKCTVVMITHRIGLVRIADYVATIGEGQMVSVQRTAEFMAQHAPAPVPSLVHAAGPNQEADQRDWAAEQGNRSAEREGDVAATQRSPALSHQHRA
ncbi:MAG TPA: type I secretion system permease/ATPase [Acetobacteraceae bacterium]|nr:type I secretion system permease/ATPase [Acetobacteraceae bacterium]